jgi:hypothetical protein
MEELFETCRKERIGKIITMAKQYIGTPCRVVYVRILGALPSKARPYKVRIAQ